MRSALLLFAPAVALALSLSPAGRAQQLERIASERRRARASRLAPGPPDLEVKEALVELQLARHLIVNSSPKCLKVDKLKRRGLKREIKWEEMGLVRELCVRPKAGFLFDLPLIKQARVITPDFGSKLTSQVNKFLSPSGETVKPRPAALS
ncbi:hypothetical protein AB1Y20_022621 [Prymnesium parvum]|uniref:Uncharacterized protein n=1 Tax=Prymnesium parvum TaxID=97485 RepID=A0AB34JI45_PRYPA